MTRGVYRDRTEDLLIQQVKKLQEKPEDVAILTKVSEVFGTSISLVRHKPRFVVEPWILCCEWRVAMNPFDRASRTADPKFPTEPRTTDPRGWFSQEAVCTQILLRQRIRYMCVLFTFIFLSDPEHLACWRRSSSCLASPPAWRPQGSRSRSSAPRA